MAHQKKRFVLWPIFQQVDREIGDHFGDVAFVDAVSLVVVEYWIVVAPLAGQNIPVVEPLGFGAKMPLAKHSSVVAGLAQSVSHRNGGGIEVVESWYAVDMAVLAGKNRRPAGSADGVHHIAAIEPKPLRRESVHVRRLVDLAAVGADGVGRMVIRHDEQNVRSRRRALAGGEKTEAKQCETMDESLAEHACSLSRGQILGYVRSSRG